MALDVAGLAETVQVTGESPLIDVKQNASFASIQKDTIDRIPKGRDFTSIVAVAPGTNAESYAGGIQIDGVERLGEQVHRGRHGHDEHAQRHVGQDRAGRLHPGSPGEVVRVQRRVRRRDRRRHQRHQQVGHQRDPRQRRHVLHRPAVARRDPAVLAHQSVDGRGGNFPGDLEEVYGRDNDSWNNWNPVFDIGGPVMRGQAVVLRRALAEPERLRADRQVHVPRIPSGPRRPSTGSTGSGTSTGTPTTQLGSNLRVKVSGVNQWNTTAAVGAGLPVRGLDVHGVDGQPGGAERPVDQRRRGPAPPTTATS